MMTRPTRVLLAVNQLIQREGRPLLSLSAPW
jgi:hypothetical protein